MSYLGFPRLNFAGTFQSDICTVNNIPPYYDNNMFEPRFQWRMNMPDYNGLWHPKGSNAIRLTDVRITSGSLPDGNLLTTRAQDPLIGCRVADDDLRAHGKFVDLDPQNQMVSELYGVRMRILDGEGNEVLRGDFAPSPVDDVWLRARLPSGRFDPSGSYQSVLTGLQWGEVRSPVLQAIRAATTGDMLSVKMVMDSVEDGVEHWPDNVTYGRIVGSIGPHLAGEPRQFVAGRRLRKAADSPLNPAPCRVDEAASAVFVDLGNSTPTTARGGPLVDLGPLNLVALGPEPKVLAPLTGTEPAAYERTAGIAVAKLTREQLEIARNTPLAIRKAVTGETLLAENADATYLRCDKVVFRLHPGKSQATATTVVHATKFGRPAAGVEVFLGTGKEPAAFGFPKKVTTGPDGRALISLSGKDPGNPRKWVDGVAVECPYGFTADAKEPEGQLAVRIFDPCPVPANPTWVRNVQPILQQYSNLYPSMNAILDLGNYNHVVRHQTYIRRTLLAPPESPNHMPVTRDLSPGRRDMIVKWLDTKPAPPILEIETVEDLRATLQQALLVELATIPPYLATLFSIKPGHNVKIAELIRGVVIEEMQHLAQVCNILNAVGGKPQIGRPALVPTYPGKLPGPVMPDVNVRLRRLSIEHVRNCFMAIEQPDHPTVDGKEFKGAVIKPENVQLDQAGNVKSVPAKDIRALEDWFNKAEYTPMTIGWFYDRIARGISKLDNNGKLFTGDPNLQVSWPDAPGVLYRVTDKKSALLAIYQIVEQGEGSPHDLDGDDLADPNELGHYYRFAEIVEGRQLVRTASGEWKYEGPEIPFDPAGVYPVADDADTFRLPAGSQSRRASEACDESYTNLLTALNRLFNGHPEEFDNTVGLMYQIQLQAKALYDTPAQTDAGAVLGPAFQSPGLRF
uniref:Iminophenyl-pyruvate dimer synthase domain-containing protein n=1 Tax=uncultured bacterium esnapd4 TaxID=1366610 RepID=S5TKH3_9BACT|nr:hypothetical protein [uncultured bacterium esnapd4]QEO74996.1 omn21 [uncultured bacterium]